MYKVIGVIVVVDMKSGLIVKADCTLATELARQYIAQCLIGYNLSNGHEELQNILERQYQGSAKKAVATARRIIKCICLFKNESRCRIIELAMLETDCFC